MKVEDLKKAVFLNSNLDSILNDISEIDGFSKDEDIYLKIDERVYINLIKDDDKKIFLDFIKGILDERKGKLLNEIEKL